MLRELDKINIICKLNFNTTYNEQNNEIVLRELT